ncbi:MAG: 30S ribosomal protein S3 [Conexivisphaerales archaeon]
MPYGKALLARYYKFAELDEFLAQTLKEAGYGGSELEKLPLGYRLHVFVVRPGLVIGRKGLGIKDLTDILSQRFGLDNLTINVEEVTNPDLNPRIVASRIASMAERGMAFRRAANMAMNSIMRAGALGCIIVIRGKLRSERSHFERYTAGVVPVSGYTSKVVVKQAVTSVLLKMGLYGINVRIAYRDVLPPEFELKKQQQQQQPQPQPQSQSQQQENKQPQQEAEKPQPKPEPS